ncbi:MAG: serine/threonine-protein phosphatase [Alphaproteobacteria bacterium]|nr:serine/threonine-protein phosphatase [Alphaproteobacteria bacterium]
MAPHPGTSLGPLTLAEGRWVAAGRTHVGHWRERNEDSLVIDAATNLCAVADGMGGAPAGDLASRLAIEALRTSLPVGPEARDLAPGFAAANQALLDVAEHDPALAGMGTTLSALLLGPSVVAIAHVGDSRIYRFAGRQLTQISVDETLGMAAVRAGRLSEAEARHRHDWHVLTQVIGSPGGVVPQRYAFRVEPGEMFLLCSDGLSDMLSDEAIATVFADRPGDPAAITAALLGQALAAGGRDNITVVVAAYRG